MVDRPREFTQEVYAYVSKIPAGKVMTYGTIARALGRPHAARSVGNILKRNPNPFYKVKGAAIKSQRQSSVPCHRVVRGDLRIGGYSGGAQAKRDLLRNEGVKMDGNRIAREHVQNPLAHF